MTRHVHFVGSIGLDSAEEVFDAIGATVKDHVNRCPDGEPRAAVLAGPAVLIP